MEEWVKIPTYSNYEITKCGKVRSIKNGTIKQLNGSTNNKGYLNFRLTENGVTKTITIARLLLMSFGRLPELNEVCDHIDRNKSNNRLDNLRWVSQSVNNSNRTSKKKYTGVYYKKNLLKNGTEKIYYQAKISIKGKTVSIGYYKSDYEAHLAYVNKFQEIYKVSYKLTEYASLS
jgi:hypothetical protein